MNILNEITITFTLGFTFAFVCGLILGIAIEKNKKKKAGLKPANVDCSRKLYQVRGGRSMKNFNKGDLVYAVDLFYGSYIGEFIGYQYSPSHMAKVKILACIRYPKQFAIFFTDRPVERDPYPYGSIVHFQVDSIGKYVGAVNDYNTTCKNAIYIALKNCKPIEKEILEKHLARYSETRAIPYNA